MNSILIVGITAGGAKSLSEAAVARILSADLLIGGKRHLSYFPTFKGDTLAITNNIPEIVQKLKSSIANRQSSIVLASGDPLFYGIGVTLRRYFSAEQLEILPAPSSMQLAFAALGESWHDAKLLSAHGRPIERVISEIMTGGKCGVLTDNVHTPREIARRLLVGGMSAETLCAICENLGSNEQRIIRTTLGTASRFDYAKLNVFVIWNERPVSPIPPSLSDDAFVTHNKQITKREVRLLTLAELGLRANEVFWDIGAGSGAVSIEVARSQPTTRVWAVEKRAALCAVMRENMQRFPCHNVRLVQGVAPDVLTDWPRPNAIFIGGSGGNLPSIISYAKRALADGGRLVANFATLENLQVCRQLLPNATVTQLNVSRGKPILNALRFEGLNPVFIVVWQRKVLYYKRQRLN